MAEPAAEQTRHDAEEIKSKRVTLADLSAKGSALYAHKNYDEASDVFSRASVLQAEINGELHPDNAEILFHYGRSLFKVGQSKSDVLGGPAAADKRVAAADGALDQSASAVAAQVQQLVGADPAAQDAKPEPSEDAKPEPTKDAKSGPGKEDAGARKPLFQFTGDENFDHSDAEDEDEVGRKAWLPTRNLAHPS